MHANEQVPELHKLWAELDAANVEGEARLVRPRYYLKHWRTHLRSTREIVDSGQFILFLRDFKAVRERERSMQRSLGLGRGTKFAYSWGADSNLGNAGYAQRCVTVQRPQQDAPSGRFALLPVFADDWMSFVRYASGQGRV